jgi:hypothetical protein
MYILQDWINLFLDIICDALFLVVFVVVLCDAMYFCKQSIHLHIIVVEGCLS